MPDLIRRGRIPRVGINASRATIILRIVAEGESEAECRAQIESTVAEIHEHLGTLVYGEGDDELQDVVLRLLGQRGQTLASAEIATAGLVTQWLAKVDGGDGHYRGGLVAADEAAMIRLLPLGSAALAPSGEAFARAVAIACRRASSNRFRPGRWTLAVGRRKGRGRAGPFRLGFGGRRADVSRIFRHSPRHCRGLLCQARDQPGTPGAAAVVGWADL